MKPIFELEDDSGKVIEHFNSLTVLDEWLEQHALIVSIDLSKFVVDVDSDMLRVLIGEIVKNKEAGEKSCFLYGNNTKESDRRKLKMLKASFTGLSRFRSQ